jgi:uncharacterized membrane protein
MNDNSRVRLYLLDEIRGFLIYGVIVSHTLFDLRYIFGYSIPWAGSAFVQTLFEIGACLFILISGMVTKYSRDNLDRGYKLLAIAMTITLLTDIFMPDMVMYLGILQHLAFAIIISELLMPVLKKIPRIAGIILSLLVFILTRDIYHRVISFFGLFKVNIPEDMFDGGLSYLLGFDVQGIQLSSDYYPMLPWMMMFFLGIFLIDYIEKEPLKTFFSKSRCVFLQKSGRVSLWIYLVHQPVVYGVIYLLKNILKII